MSVHPSTDDLERFVRGELADEWRSTKVALHLEACELCRDMASNMTVYYSIQPPEHTVKQAMQIGEICEGSYNVAMQGTIIDLVPLVVGVKSSTVVLAADGLESSRPPLQTLATLFSDNPEVVLRAVRDSWLNEEYLQLIADDPALTRHVLIETTDPDRQFVTDNKGRATMAFRDWEQLAGARWHIQMPELSFELEPLQHEADTVEAQTPMVIDNKRGDVIEVTYQKLAIGCRVLVRVKSIGGDEDYHSARVIISEESGSSKQDIVPHRLVEFTLSSNDRINIRMYR